jgi:hypothetical protein
MSKLRASVFEEAPDLDVGSFAPKTAIDEKAPRAEQVRAVAEAARFPSREATIREEKLPTVQKPAKRAPRYHRTGRNVQFNVKALQETVDAFYAVTESQPGWVLGYTLQRAIEALKRELGSQA